MVVINAINMGLSSHHVLHGWDVDVALLDASRGQLRCENQGVAGHHNVTWEDWGIFKQTWCLLELTRASSSVKKKVAQKICH